MVSCALRHAWLLLLACTGSPATAGHLAGLPLCLLLPVKRRWLLAVQVVTHLHWVLRWMLLLLPAEQALLVLLVLQMQR